MYLIPSPDSTNIYGARGGSLRAFSWRRRL